jgi:hypothetical protein
LSDILEDQYFGYEKYNEPMYLDEIGLSDMPTG